MPQPFGAPSGMQAKPRDREVARRRDAFGGESFGRNGHGTVTQFGALSAPLITRRNGTTLPVISPAIGYRNRIVLASTMSYSPGLSVAVAFNGILTGPTNTSMASAAMPAAS